MAFSLRAARTILAWMVPRLNVLDPRSLAGKLWLENSIPPPWPEGWCGAIDWMVEPDA
ncbi:hypothetical protein ZHAS_00013594 [Anopheles sinensis]|uniref:Uncharacterized protein n=1 Tax=Anopheles sinensis TaxID=74873 RepID=A0A084W5W0_ANOSI|nr:hypothetical protein ZHAS_00013594 [Anopheles sinensis]